MDISVTFRLLLVLQCREGCKTLIQALGTRGNSCSVAFTAYSLPFRDMGNGWVDGKGWDPLPEKTVPEQQRRFLWLMWGQQSPQDLLPLAAQPLHGSTVLKLPLVTSVSTWRGTDFAGLRLSTEFTISKIPLERVTLPSLSCALGWWRAFPHAETSSQLQALWNAPQIPSLLCPASVA